MWIFSALTQLYRPTGYAAYARPFLSPALELTLCSALVWSTTLE